MRLMNDSFIVENDIKVFEESINFYIVFAPGFVKSGPKSVYATTHIWDQAKAMCHYCM